MIYFTLTETLRALLLFFLLGLGGGAVYEGMRLFFSNVTLLPRVTAVAWRRVFLRRGSAAEVRRTAGGAKPLCGACRFFCTFLFTLALGIVYFLFQYYAFDGVFRLYFPVVLLLVLGLFEKRCAPLLRRAEHAVLSFLSAVFYFFLVLFLFPIAVFARFAVRYLFCPLFFTARRVGIRVRHAFLRRRHLAVWKRELHRMRGF